jgi:hypothetical protein
MAKSKIITGLKEAVRHAREMNRLPIECCECGIKQDEWYDWAGGSFANIYERRGKPYCDSHLMDTPEKRAYERWFVDPNS